MADSYIDATQEDFTEKVLQSSQLVLVNFSAEQIPACQIQDPEFAAVSKDLQGRVSFVRVKVDRQSEFTQQWNVDSVPTLLFFKSGNEVYRIPGIVMRDRLRRQLEGVLLSN